MKLSQLVHYLRELDKFQKTQVLGNVDQVLSPWVHKVSSDPIQFNLFAEQLVANYQTVVSNVAQFDATMQQLKNAAKEAIKANEPEYFANSENLYFNDMCMFDTTDSILNRRLDLNDETKKILSSRIALHTDWHYPGLIIRPGQEDWIDHLVSLDPLYVADNNLDLLAPIKSKFNPQYLNRLRMITINEKSEDVLASVPNDQIYFCLAYYFFNFKPLSLVNRYIKSVYQKLRPGGVFAFTVNDCDRLGGVDLTERNYSCYTPLSMIVEFATSLGFEVQRRDEITSAVTWIELRKPGQASSLRGGQVLSMLVSK